MRGPTRIEAMSMHRVAIHLLFFLSGASGLVYQVAWVRQFGTVLGNTVHSAALVTSVFMGGLGVGAWAAGAWVDRRRESALRAYGFVELGIAALALILALALPNLSGAVAGLSSYAVLDNGWQTLSAGSRFTHLAIAATGLAPPAILMGATLTLLARNQIGSAGEAGWRMGLLYGVNTAGAALGALVTDLALVPLLGLFGTQLLAVGGNVLAGTVALAISGSGEISAPEDAKSAGFSGVWICLFLAGIAAMGMEMAWFRFLAGALGPYRAVFSVLLATMLVGLALGAALAGSAHRRFGRPTLLFAIAQAAFVITALWALAAFDPEQVLRRQLGVALSFLESGPAWRQVLLHRVNGTTIALLVFLPSIAMGAAFPLGNALAQDAADKVGRRVGELYLATTLGNVIGALLAGFVLLPGVGLQRTVLILAVVAAVAPFPLLRWSAIALPTAAAGLALAIFGLLPPDHLLWRTFPANRAKDEGVLAVREGLEQIIVVTGDEEAGPVRLWTTGHPMTSTTPHAQRYMRLLSHLPLLAQESPERALVIAFGAGNSLHAASLHPTLRELEVADLSRDILELAPLFRHANRNVLEDPRVSVFVNDGRHHLYMRPEGHFDLITLEPPPLAATGVSSLYTREFYELAKSRLSTHGVLTQWLPAYQVPEPVVRALVRSFVEVFDDAVLLVGSGREMILVGGISQLNVDAIDRRIQSRPEVRADLEGLGLGTARELAATFASPASVLAQATAESGAVTDNRPMLENAQVSHLMQTRLPSDLIDPSRIGEWCPKCPDNERLRRTLVVARAAYSSDAFLSFNGVGPDSTSRIAAPDFENETLDAIAASEALRRLLFCPDALALRAAELHDAGDTWAARQHLDAAQFQAPHLALLDELEAQWR